MYSFNFSLLVHYGSGFSFCGFGSVKMRMCVLVTTAVIVMTVDVVYVRLEKKYVSNCVLRSVNFFLD